MTAAHPGSCSQWVGPFRLRTYLERCLDPKRELPQEAPGVYVVSRKAWKQQPSAASQVLYVGGNPNRHDYFRRRVWLLVMNMLGFGGRFGYDHAGGRRIWEWCRHSGVHPLDLYLGWVAGIECVRCTEGCLYAQLGPALGRSAPARCPKHGEA
jgi:hypothetical protein